ncbi:MAG: ABC transporter permease subunit [Desulfobacterales bacterium]|nr:ABC transporter permease subunit [Desulfobacterales bacterium]
MIAKKIKNPLARKRLMRFKEVRRAYFALWALALLYAVSLCAELLCNNVPLFVRFNGRSFFPVFAFYPEDTFTGNGQKTRADFKQVARLPAFRDNPENFIVFPPLPFGPFESVDPALLAVADRVTLDLRPEPLIGSVDLGPDYRIVKSLGFAPFAGLSTAAGAVGRPFSDFFELDRTLRQAIDQRFANRPAPRFTTQMTRRTGPDLTLGLPAFAPRPQPPQTVRLVLREAQPENVPSLALDFSPEAEPLLDSDLAGLPPLWAAVSVADRQLLKSLVHQRFSGPVEVVRLVVDNRVYQARFVKEDVRFPFPPGGWHLMGIDGAGRDVLARILYGLRTSLTFGLLLVGCSMALGVIAGALQGYYGGLTDITGQRLIEIWSALPFLYIMILMGSVYGRSFALLLFCYGIFNWIGISYYIRAEFLRLRKQPFVEAAKCMGISSPKIIFRHILPNAMVPVITFFPFSLVGAIGSLAALDFLGFGLPPPTPSWGELLFQAQQYRWAWWLILYPSLALFVVMLLGVFVGEGIRNAYEPRRYTRIE